MATGPLTEQRTEAPTAPWWVEHELSEPIGGKHGDRWTIKANDPIGVRTIAKTCGTHNPLLKESTEKAARLMAAAPELLEALAEAVESSGHSLSGPTDWRAAEHGEPRWVCRARSIIAKAKGSAH